MKRLILATVLMGLAGVASAADSCEARADSKKLNGAARTSFVKKCMATGAAPLCTTQADEKKLHGAARNSFIKKCESR